VLVVYGWARVESLWLVDFALGVMIPGPCMSPDAGSRRTSVSAIRGGHCRASVPVFKSHLVRGQPKGSR
jgi:hypothetical protein